MTQQVDHRNPKADMELIASLQGKAIPFELDGVEIFILISSLQLATIHPDMSQKMTKLITNATRKMQDALTKETSQEIGKLLELGWNREYDVPSTPKQDR